MRKVYLTDREVSFGDDNVVVIPCDGKTREEFLKLVRAGLRMAPDRVVIDLSVDSAIKLIYAII